MKKSLQLKTPPSLWKNLGPSFILLGLALGSGELILWPYLAANWGLGLLWGALLGISLQYVLNTEVMRYSLAWSESVFVGFRRLSILIPVWYIVSTAIPWSIPGFSSAAAEIVHRLLPFLPIQAVAIFLLLLAGTVLSVGKSLYKTMVRFQTAVILIGMLIIIALTFMFTNIADWQMAGWGILGNGGSWWFFPAGVQVTAFLAAFAYAGAGGNLNLAQSFYIKEKGFGMGVYAEKVGSVLRGTHKETTLRGQTFTQNTANTRRWKEWWRHVTTEHFLIFWLLGFVTIVLLSVLSYATVYSHATESGLSFLYAESKVIGDSAGNFVRIVFLSLAAMMLFSTQLGVLESSARIISENIVLLTKWKKNKADVTASFSIVVWSQIAIGILVYALGFTEPRVLITLSAILNAAAMMVSFILIGILNKKRLLPAQQPHIWRTAFLILGAVFFALLLALTVFS